MNDTTDLLAMEDSVRWYDHALNRADRHVLRRDQILRLRFKEDIEEAEESVKVGLRNEGVLC